MSIELLLPSTFDGWSAKRIFEFEHAQAIIERALAMPCDLTNNLTGTWTTLGMVLALFENEGRKLFMRLSKPAPGFIQFDADEKWHWCVKNSKYKGISKLVTIAKQLNVDTTIPNTEDVVARTFLPEDVSIDAGKDLDEFGFYAHNNKYYGMVKSPNGFTPIPFSNFVMRVLFHIEDDRKPRRLIEVTNFKNTKKTVDVTTDRLTSEGKFKEFIEGLGNFLWEGTAIQLSRLKRKLFEEEENCYQLEQLGWHEDGVNSYYAFSNGVFTSEFVPVDGNGIIQLEETSVYIPSGNKAYKRNRFMYAAEKKFLWQPCETNFEKWALLFVGAYGDPGILAFGYNLACLFSDIIYRLLKGFPMLYFYGEGGSGKGSIIKSCQSLYGEPQSPLTLTGKANTDKAKIRKFAQFKNAMILLEEFSNSLSVDSIMMIRALWDRMGYERSVLDSKFGTENVPIESGVGITGNDYPIDDPLLQRLLIVEMNKNQFTDESREKWRNLTRVEDTGISSIVGELIPLRQKVKDQFEIKFDEVYKEIDTKLAGINVTERMIKNLCSIITITEIVREVFQLPFTYQEMLAYGCLALERQNEKRGNAGDVQKFFDCLLWLIKNRKITHDREYVLDGGSLFLRFREIHPEYMMAYAQIYRLTGLGKSSMSDKLKISEFFVKSWDSKRFGTYNTSCYEFNNRMLRDNQIDLSASYQAALDEERKYAKTKVNSTAPPVNVAEIGLSTDDKNDRPF